MVGGPNILACQQCRAGAESAPGWDGLGDGPLVDGVIYRYASTPWGVVAAVPPRSFAKAPVLGVGLSCVLEGLGCSTDKYYPHDEILSTCCTHLRGRSLHRQLSTSCLTRSGHYLFTLGRVPCRWASLCVSVCLSGCLSVSTRLDPFSNPAHVLRLLNLCPLCSIVCHSRHLPSPLYRDGPSRASPPAPPPSPSQACLPSRHSVAECSGSGGPPPYPHLGRRAGGWIPGVTPPAAERGTAGAVPLHVRPPSRTRRRRRRGHRAVRFDRLPSSVGRVRQDACRDGGVCGGRGGGGHPDVAVGGLAPGLYVRLVRLLVGCVGGALRRRPVGGGTAPAAAVAIAGGGDAEAPPASAGAAAAAEGAAAAAAHRWQVMAEAFLAAAAGAGVAGVLRMVGGVPSGGVRVAAGAVAGGAAAAAGRWRGSPPVSLPEVVGDGSSGGGAAVGSSTAVAPPRAVFSAAAAGFTAAAGGTVMAARGGPWVDATAVPLVWGAAVGAAWVAALLTHTQTVAPYWDPADWGSLARPGGVLAAGLAALAVPAAVRLGAEGGVAAAAAGASRFAAARAAGATVEQPATADWQRAARARSLRLVIVAVVETVFASGEVFGWWGHRRLGLVSTVFLLGAVGLSDAGTGIAWVFS